MCRLLYLPERALPATAEQRSEWKIQRNVKLLKRWLQQLEDSNGGHGNGLATVEKGAVKGVKLSAKRCARIISRTVQPVVWHTRRISCGAQVDELCHPFSTGDATRGWLIHNGHWAKGAFGAALLKGCWSDSRVAALYIKLYGWKAFTEVCDRGVWIHLTPTGRQVHYCSGSLFVEQDTGALCSEPTKLWGTWLPAAHGTYDEKEPVQIAKPVAPGELVAPDGVVFRSTPKPKRQPTSGRLFSGWDVTAPPVKSEPTDEELKDGGMPDYEPKRVMPEEDDGDGCGIDDKTGKLSLGKRFDFDEFRFRRMNGFVSK
jgi:hypothetical protein